MKALSTSETRNVPIIRPLRELASLIREDLKSGDEAAQQAGLPYYRAAGEKMLEAKGQMKHGEFMEWIDRNFEIKKDQAQRYMKLASTTIDTQNTRQPRTLTEAIGEQPREERARGPAWHEPVKDVIDKVDTDTLNMHHDEINRREDRDAQRKLGLQLLDIGYRVLASQLHPDKGGSKEAMARLNRVRDRFKQYA